jgi:hypothetical protein
VDLFVSVHPHRTLTNLEPIPSTGSRLGHYVFLSELAKGPFGVLYELRAEIGAAELRALGRVVPLPAELPPEAASALSAAVKSSLTVCHDLAVPVADFLRGNDWAVLVHDHVDGHVLRSLHRRVQEAKSTVPAGVAVRIALDVLDGLEQSAHGCQVARVAYGAGGTGINSLYLCRDGHTRALDGQLIAALVRTEQTRNHVSVIGFPAPELVDPEKQLDERTDVFAVGALLWELLTCRELSLGSAVVQAKRPQPKAPNVSLSVPRGMPQIPHELAQAVNAALELEETLRPASLSEFRSAITQGVEVSTHAQVSEFFEALLKRDPAFGQGDATPNPMPRLRLSDELRRAGIVPDDFKRGAEHPLTAANDSRLARPATTKSQLPKPATRSITPHESTPIPPSVVKTESRTPRSGLPQAKPVSHLPKSGTPPAKPVSHLPPPDPPPAKSETHLPPPDPPPAKSETHLPPPDPPPAKSETHLPKPEPPPAKSETHLPTPAPPSVKADAHLATPEPPSTRAGSQMPKSAAPPVKAESQMPRPVPPSARAPAPPPAKSDLSSSSPNPPSVSAKPEVRLPAEAPGASVAPVVRLPAPVGVAAPPEVFLVPPPGAKTSADEPEDEFISVLPDEVSPLSVAAEPAEAANRALQRPVRVPEKAADASVSVDLDVPWKPATRRVFKFNLPTIVIGLALTIAIAVAVTVMVQGGASSRSAKARVATTRPESTAANAARAPLPAATPVAAETAVTAAPSAAAIPEIAPAEGTAAKAKSTAPADAEDMAAKAKSTTPKVSRPFVPIAPAAKSVPRRHGGGYVPSDL